MSGELQQSYWPVDNGAGISEVTTGELLRRVASEVPETLALVEVAPPGPSLVEGVASTERRWSYAQLLAEAEHTARWLLGRFEPGEHIAVWAPNLPEWVMLQYGAALAGLVLVTANPALRTSELEYLLRQSRAAGIACLDEFRGNDMAAVVEEIKPRLPLLRHVVSFTAWEREVRSAPVPDLHLPDVSPGQAAQLQFTSGTTGFPKGALLSHRALITNARFVHRRAEFPEGGIWATALPLFHTAGCGMSVLGTAASRGTLVLAQFFEPTLVLGALEKWEAYLFAAVPAMHNALLANDKFDTYDLSALKVAASGGDAVPPALVAEAERRYGARFSTVYGQTELSPIVTQTSPADSPIDKSETVGRPLWQVEVKIADPRSGVVLEAGQEGEICARGYQLMLGYFDMPDETTATIDVEGWLHTGDLGSMDSRGYVKITGRLKDMIIRGGENIYPREIEAALSGHPGVAASAVLGIPDPAMGERVVAVIRARNPVNPPGSEDLSEFLRRELAHFKIPRSWYLAETLPANAMGKVQKFLIREQIVAGTLPELPSRGGGGDLS
ncbi:MAG: AMP-binding protein [Actinomycetota bacterium]|nr:AMP-binding protein [Actinomycetota bacterium]